MIVSCHAIVSADDCISDATGEMPPGLRNEADWAQFQDQLDRADLVVVGRLGHQAFPNVRNRRRLVLSSSARGLEQRPDAWWWNPTLVAWQDAAMRIVPDGGHVAVTGGRMVFDLFLEIGIAAFHLARATKFFLPDGQKAFSACADGRSVATILTGAGLRVAETRLLDAGAGVTLDIWSRRG